MLSSWTSLAKRRHVLFPARATFAEANPFGVHVMEGEEQRTRKAIQDVLNPTRQEPGCLEINAFSSISDPRLFYINSRWTAEVDFDQHLKLPHTLKFLTDIKEPIDRPLEVTRSRPV